MWCRNNNTSSKAYLLDNFFLVCLIIEFLCWKLETKSPIVRTLGKIFKRRCEKSISIQNTLVKINMKVALSHGKNCQIVKTLPIHSDFVNRGVFWQWKSLDHSLQSRTASKNIMWALNKIQTSVLILYTPYLSHTKSASLTVDPRCRQNSKSEWLSRKPTSN